MTDDDITEGLRMTNSASGNWRRPMTKVSVVVLASVAALAIDADRTSAQGAAWCLVGGNSGRSCGYYTFEQCLASRAGGTSHCIQNPNFPGSASDANRPTRSGPRR
jgi:hypothetical protein